VTLGRALLELGDLDAARQELQTVLGGAPENLSAVRGLAEIHHRRGDMTASLAQYQTALLLAPNDPDLEQTVAEMTQQTAAVARQEALVVVEPVPPNPERDRALHTIAALEDFLAAVHAAGANRRS
jgi:predicted Zn-dependent protease